VRYELPNPFIVMSFQSEPLYKSVNECCYGKEGSFVWIVVVLLTIETFNDS